MSTYFARTSVTSPRYSPPTGTLSPGNARPFGETANERSARVALWLASDLARRFDGRWVLLSDSNEVMDDDPSAAELTRRHAEREDRLVVFVQPPRTRLG
jgi:hypothetical protein